MKIRGEDYDVVKDLRTRNMLNDISLEKCVFLIKMQMSLIKSNKLIACTQEKQLNFFLYFFLPPDENCYKLSLSSLFCKEVNIFFVTSV